MKIEKLNDNQIRCTLTREDLADREIKLSELAYGSEKTKSLFRDMMQQASHDFGFEADNLPLMIEAIPVSMDSIILIITKVEDPEELDSRFSRFSLEEDSENGKHTTNPSDLITGADDILNLIHKINQAKKEASAKEASHTDNKSETKTEVENSTSDEEDAAYELTRFFMFRDLKHVIRVSALLAPCYSGPNSLFKNNDTQEYYLLIKKADTLPEQFNRICNTLSEYGSQLPYADGMDEFFTEHMTVLCADEAIQQLSRLKQ